MQRNRLYLGVLRHRATQTIVPVLQYILPDGSLGIAVLTRLPKRPVDGGERINGIALIGDFLVRVIEYPNDRGYPEHGQPRRLVIHCQGMIFVYDPDTGRTTEVQSGVVYFENGEWRLPRVMMSDMEQLAVPAGELRVALGLFHSWRTNDWSPALISNQREEGRVVFQELADIPGSQDRWLTGKRFCGGTYGVRNLSNRTTHVDGPLWPSLVTDSSKPTHQYGELRWRKEDGQWTRELKRQPSQHPAFGRKPAASAPPPAPVDKRAAAAARLEKAAAGEGPGKDPIVLIPDDGSPAGDGRPKVILRSQDVRPADVPRGESKREERRRKGAEKAARRAQRESGSE